MTSVAIPAFRQAGAQDWEQVRDLLLAAALPLDGARECLANFLLALAAERGVDSVSLLTTTAETFFPRFGFEAVPRDVLPRALQSSAEFRGACPDSAIAMIRRIVAHQTNR